MSITSRDVRGPPPGRRGSSGASLPLSPTPGGILRHSPSSAHSLHRTPPSPSVAPSFTPSAANVSAALWAFRNASAASSVVESDAPLSIPVPRVAGTTPEHAGAPALPPLMTTSEDILRGIYNEKLHASVRSIIATLSSELPADHIFLQLMADPSTQQYCKVRLTEVVEGFLYSTQAEQYHELATELARRERDCDTQQQRILELEAALAHAVNEAQQQRADNKSGGGDNISRSPSAPSHVPSVAAASVVESDAAGPSLPSKPANPMEDEEARRELLRVLEQATHDQELHRCRQALHAVTKVVGMTSGASTYEDKFLYEEEVMGELYKCVDSLLQYVDGALESQERLRREILEQHPWMLTHNAGEGDLTHQAGNVVSSDYLTPQRPRVHLGSTGHGNNGSVFSSAVSSHLSSASVQRSQQQQQQQQQQRPPMHTQQHGVDEIHERREELQRLSQQLRNAQLASRQVLEQLAHGEAHHRREVAQLQRAVEAARDEAAVAVTTAAAAGEAKNNAERLRVESAATAAAERTELRDTLADVRAQLAATTHDLQAARREAQRLTARIDEADKRDAELSSDAAAAKAALHKTEVQLREQRAECAACQAELTELKATHHADVDALQDAARELLCLRVEKTMAGLSSTYQEAKAAKAELLERDGYRHLCNVYSGAAAAQQEAARHVHMQLQVAETTQLEKAMAQQSAVDALGVLLRSMWADDVTEATLEPSPVERDAGGAAIHAGNGPLSHVQPSSEVAAGTAAISHAQRYRLPTTLAGLCSALEYAYANARARHRGRQKTIDALRTTLIGKDVELRAAQANDAQLRDLLRAERAKEDQWRAEMAQLSENNPMRDLLARQDVLLKAVSDERNALRRQWGSLSGDYIALEQRNGVLHARCAEKEHENARLSGMLLRSATSNSSTPRPAAVVVSKPLHKNGSAHVATGTAPPPPQTAADEQTSTPGNRLSFSADSPSASPSSTSSNGEKKAA